MKTNNRKYCKVFGAEESIQIILSNIDTVWNLHFIQAKHPEEVQTVHNAVMVAIADISTHARHIEKMLNQILASEHRILNKEGAVNGNN